MMKERQWPSLLVIDTREFIRDFNTCAGNEIYGVDLIEVINQIYQELLNGAYDNLPNLPYVERLINKDFTTHKHRLHKVKDAVYALAGNIYNRINDLGFSKGDEIPYIFVKFINNDMILSHIPY